MAVSGSRPNVNRPSVQKGTNQRVSQAKGLVANVGKYKDAKTLNLTNKQLGAGGQKAATARKIDISKTQYDSTRKQVLGPMGKPITGRVDMGGGNIAVYKNGVRVKAAVAKPKADGRDKAYDPKKDDVKPDVERPKSGDGKGTPLRPIPDRSSPSMSDFSRMEQSARSKADAVSRNAASARTRQGPLAAERKPIGRDTGNHKPTMYANGTARVWDPKLVKFVTVGKSDSRHPKSKGK